MFLENTKMCRQFVDANQILSEGQRVNASLKIDVQQRRQPKLQNQTALSDTHQIYAKKGTTNGYVSKRRPEQHLPLRPQQQQQQKTPAHALRTKNLRTAQAVSPPARIAFLSAVHKFSIPKGFASATKGSYVILRKENALTLTAALCKKSEEYAAVHAVYVRGRLPHSLVGWLVEGGGYDA